MIEDLIKWTNGFKSVIANSGIDCLMLPEEVRFYIEPKQLRDYQNCQKLHDCIGSIVILCYRRGAGGFDAFKKICLKRDCTRIYLLIS